MADVEDDQYGAMAGACPVPRRPSGASHANVVPTTTSANKLGRRAASVLAALWGVAQPMLARAALLHHAGSIVAARRGRTCRALSAVARGCAAKRGVAEQRRHTAVPHPALRRCWVALCHLPLDCSRPAPAFPLLLICVRSSPHHAPPRRLFPSPSPCADGGGGKAGGRSKAEEAAHKRRMLIISFSLMLVVGLGNRITNIVQVRGRRRAHGTREAAGD